MAISARAANNPNGTIHSTNQTRHYLLLDENFWMNNL